MLSDTAGHMEITGLVAVARAMAAVILRRKRQGEYLAHLGGVNEADLATDCIAELFRRNDDGSYVALRAYFSSLNIAEADDAELAVHLRRLVSSAVNQSVFRMFGDLDPGLSRIIRNIKGAVASLRTFTEMDVRGESCIAPILTDPLLHLPFPARDELLADLLPSARGSERVPELMAALATILRQRTATSRAVPLVRVALLFRDVVAVRQPPAPAADDGPDPLARVDLESAILDACNTIYGQIAEKYRVTKKLPAGLVEAYFGAVRHYLRSRLNGTGEEPGLYESLRAVGPAISKAEYRLVHRQRVEYIARLVQRKVRDILER